MSWGIEIEPDRRSAMGTREGVAHVMAEDAQAAEPEDERAAEPEQQRRGAPRFAAGVAVGLLLGWLARRRKATNQR